MRAKGIRRIPIINQEGGLEGIVSADDILDLLAEEMAELAKVAPREQEREAKQKFNQGDINKQRLRQIVVRDLPSPFWRKG